MKSSSTQHISPHSPLQRRKVESDSLTLSATNQLPPHDPSVGERLQVFRNWVEKAGSDEGWPTQLLAVLKDVKKVEDVQDWLSNLTPPLCKTRPDLLSLFAERLSGLLPGFTVEQLQESVQGCLSKASEVDQSGPVWLILCAGLRSLSPSGRQTLLDCLQRQENVPPNGKALIAHVKEIIDFMSQSLPELGFGAMPELGIGTVPGAALVMPIERAPVKLGENEIIVMDTGTDRHAIQASGATMSDAPFLHHVALTLVMAHELRDEGVDWMRPEYHGPEVPEVLLNYAQVNKHFSARFRPMLANYAWLKAEAESRIEFFSCKQPGDAASMLIRHMVDLDKQRVESLLPGAPGVAQRRLDLVLRALWLGLGMPGLEIDLPLLRGVYGQLHKRALVQLASAGQSMKPWFAQHIDLSAMPLQLLTMAYRVGPGPEPGPAGRVFGQLVQLILSTLRAYPEDVQAQTLIGVLSMVSDPTFENQLLTRLKNLTNDPASWKRPAHAWLIYQLTHVDGLLALIRDPHTAPEEDVNKLLAALQSHHRLIGEPTLLIDDPFGERYVIWTLTDIRLLGALSKRTEGRPSIPPGVVDCVVDLLKQFCSVSVLAYRFVSPQFMKLFSTEVLRSAFLQLWPEEQVLMLSRIYSPDAQTNWMDHMELVRIFAMNTDFPHDTRMSILKLIVGYIGQSPQCQDLVNELMKQMPH